VSSDIVDAQIHLNLTLDTQQVLGAMDSLGIQAVVVDEFWGRDARSGRGAPGYLLPNGAYRAITPLAEAAAYQYPERFSYLVRVDPEDPDFEQLIRVIASAPHARAVRLIARSEQTVAALARGDYGRFFTTAAAHRIPVCVFCPGNARLVRHYAELEPDNAIVLDHVGMPRDDSQFEEVLQLSSLPNVVIKWGHGPEIFHAPSYPFRPMFPYLERCLDAFGADRVMWASDFTAITTDHRWADELFAVRDSAEISAADKVWLLGGTARKTFDWAPPAELAAPPVIEH
jgi:predicted TIM-barrel fold metal-dependent hydrolase